MGFSKSKVDFENFTDNRKLNERAKRLILDRIYSNITTYVRCMEQHTLGQHGKLSPCNSLAVAVASK